MKFILKLILPIFLLVPTLHYNIFAQNKEFYNKVLWFGTDADIIKTFARIQEDLGQSVNRNVLAIFHETHSQEVYSVLVLYIAAIELRSAQDILLREFSRTDINEDYREDIIRAMGKLKKISSLEPLKQYYFNSNSSNRIKKELVDAWGEIGDRSVEDLLIQIVTDARVDREIRARAILALGKVKSVQSLDILEEIALNQHEDKYLRIYAVSSLGEIGGEAVIDILGILIKDRIHEVAEYAVNSVARVNSEKSGELLIQALRSDFDKVRYYAARGLSELKYKDAVEILKFKSEYDENELVRKEAQKALEIIQSSHNNKS